MKANTPNWRLRPVEKAEDVVKRYRIDELIDEAWNWFDKKDFLLCGTFLWYSCVYTLKRKFLEAGIRIGSTNAISALGTHIGDIYEKHSTFKATKYTQAIKAAKKVHGGTYGDENLGNIITKELINNVSEYVTLVKTLKAQEIFESFIKNFNGSCKTEVDENGDTKKIYTSDDKNTGKSRQCTVITKDETNKEKTYFHGNMYDYSKTCL